MHRSHRRTGGVAAVCLVVLATVGAGTTIASVPSGSELVLDDVQSLLVDASLYADDTGVTVVEAVRRLELQPTAGQLIYDVERAAADRFAGGWISHSPDYHVVIRLTGGDEGLEGVEALIDQSPVPVTVETDAVHTLAQLRTAQRRIRSAVSAALPGAALDIDLASGSIRVTNPISATHDAGREIEELAGVPVFIEVGPTPQPGGAYGGHKLTYSGGYCTTGFNVQQMDTGQTGITTAGHCGNSATYYWSSSTQSWSAQLLGERWDADQDAQWHSTALTEPPQFFDGTGYRTVYGYIGRTNQAGDWVCHYGLRTGWSCGYVQSVNYDPGDTYCNSGPCDPVWVTVSSSSLECYFGDSGGPVFLGGSAYGLYSGQLSSGTSAADCEFMVYMSIDRFLWPWTGLYLRTG